MSAASGRTQRLRGLVLCSPAKENRRNLDFLAIERNIFLV